MARSNDKTELYDDTSWLPPIPTRDLLPTEDIREGTLCFVTGEASIYQYVDGDWTTSPTKKK